jgi:hypothetical protein
MFNDVQGNVILSLLLCYICVVIKVLVWQRETNSSGVSKIANNFVALHLSTTVPVAIYEHNHK